MFNGSLERKGLKLLKGSLVHDSKIVEQTQRQKTVPNALPLDTNHNIKSRIGVNLS